MGGYSHNGFSLRRSGPAQNSFPTQPGTDQPAIQSYAKFIHPNSDAKSGIRSGLHGTPIDGTTLLHLSIDFDEREIFDWLLEQGADVNAPAVIDKEGFGGHTPLFNAIVSDAYVNGRQRDAYMVKRLLDLGADIHIRVNLRKYLDWRGTRLVYCEKCNPSRVGSRFSRKEDGYTGKESG